MEALFGVVGFFGAVISLVIIIIKAIKRQPKKKAFIAFVGFFALFVVAFMLSDGSNPKGTENEVKTETTSETTEKTTAQTEEPLQTEEESEEESVTEAQTEDAGHRDTSLEGRGRSDSGRSEPNYVGVIGYAVVGYEEESVLRKTDDFQNLEYWKVPTYEQDKQFWIATDTKLPHKTEVVVKEQMLQHEGWGNYSGYLLVETTESGERFYIDVENFVTRPYWESGISSAVGTGVVVAEYKQVSDYYPVNSRGEKVEIPDGTIVLATGYDNSVKNTGAGSAISADVWKEWRLGYGGVPVYFNHSDLTVIY